MARSLYICYFGVDQPLVQTQVIPYLRELMKGGHELTLLTFEPGEVDEKAVRESLAADGIEWHWLRYHKRPSVPATLLDIALGARLIRKLNAKRRFDILHARSHVPMIMAAAARKTSGHKPKLLFDIRGFLPEEYVDAGVWAEGGAIYRWFKRVETWLMREADGFVVLTEKAREILSDEIGSRPVEVIPCCVDFERRFSGNSVTARTRIREMLGIEDRFVFAHVGALGGLYLTEEIADLLATARNAKSNVFGLFLTQSDPNLIRPILEKRGFAEEDFYIGRVPAAEVESFLHASDVGVSFVRASYATKSRSPTKIPEYLAAGLPIVANAGVGDVDGLLSETGAGIILDSFSEPSMIKAASDLAGLIGRAEDLRAISETRFGLTSVGGPRYRKLYEKLCQL